MTELLIIAAPILIVASIFLSIRTIKISKEVKRLREETNILNRLNLLPDDKMKELVSLASWEVIPYLVNDLDFTYEDADKARLLIAEIRGRVLKNG